MELSALVGEVNRLARPSIESRLTPLEAEPCISLLATAAFQVDIAGFGSRLYVKARDPAHNGQLSALSEDHTTIEVSSTNLVARCAVSALDLCAATTARIAKIRKGPLGGQEKDVRGLLRSKAFASCLPSKHPIRTWLDDLVTTEDWLDLEELRNQVTHRWWRRDITVSVGTIGTSFNIGSEPKTGVIPTQCGPFAGKVEVHLPSGKTDLLDALPRFAAFAEERWLDFIGRVAALP